MQLPRKLILAGVLLGLITIALGVVAIVTQFWINIKLNANNVNLGTYSLFSCNNVLCSSRRSEFRIVQGLEIAGVAAILAGVIIAVLLDIFSKNRWIHLLPQILLFGGPTVIFLGLLLYAKYVFEDFTELTYTIELDYSLILIIVACLLGFLTAVYFAFAAGLGRHHRHFSSITVIQKSERF